MAFPTTRWTLLAKATLNGDASGRASLARLCEHYRRPVMAHLRSRGMSVVEVEDATQDFFLKLLEARVWKRADPSRGRFRTFMLAVLNNFLLHRVRNESRQKRGSGTEPDSLDWLAECGMELAEPAKDESAIFDREWALTVVNEAMIEVALENERKHASTSFAVLRHFLPGATSPPSYESAAAELGVSQVAVRTAVSRLRQQFRESLRQVVSRTVAAPHEVDEELRYLAALLMKPEVSLS